MKTLLGICLLISISLLGQETPSVSPNPSTSAANSSSPSATNSDTHEGRLIHRVNPVYPSEALRKRVEGSVELTATIQKDGTLRDVSTRSGDPSLASAAIKAVKQWKYDPYTLHGQPVEVETAIKVNFKLPQRVHSSQGVTEGLLVRSVAPEYPTLTRMAKVQGSVVMSAVIGTDGKIKDLKVQSGHPMLAQAALDAVKQWEYKPYLLDGVPVEVDSQITVNFQLSGH
jgi:TonB family protein